MVRKPAGSQEEVGRDQGWAERGRRKPGVAGEPLLGECSSEVQCGDRPEERAAGHAGHTAAQMDLSPGPRAGLQPHEHALRPRQQGDLGSLSSAFRRRTEHRL